MEGVEPELPGRHPIRTRKQDPSLLCLCIISAKGQARRFQFPFRFGRAGEVARRGERRPPGLLERGFLAAAPPLGAAAPAAGKAVAASRSWQTVAMACAAAQMPKTVAGGK